MTAVGPPPCATTTLEKSIDTRSSCRDAGFYGHAGGDFLDGGGGADRLTGGMDADAFFFGAAGDRDTIADFADDIDRIRLGDGFGFASAAEALGFAEQVGGNVVFSFGGGEALTVLGTTVGKLEDDLLV